MTVWWTQTFQKPAPFLTRREVSVRIQIKTRGWLLNKQSGELEVDDLNILSNLGWWCVWLPSCRESISLSMTWGSRRHWARLALVVTKLLYVMLVLDVLPIIWTKYVHFQARRMNEENEQTFLNFKIFFIIFIFSSVQFSRSVISNSLQPHELQHARPPCPSPTPWVHPNSRPSSWWCHLAISSSVVPFSSCPQSLPASESFPMSQLFAWGGQSTGVSALALVLPMNTQDWSLLEWTGWISLQYEKAKTHLTRNIKRSSSIWNKKMLNSNNMVA